MRSTFRTTAVALALMLAASAVVNADLKYTMRAEMKPAPAGASGPANPMLAQAGAAMMQQLAPSGPAEIVYIVSDKGVRTEFKQAAQLAPRQIRYLLRVAEVTIATGVLNVIASGRAQQLADPLSSRWAIVLGLGILLAIGLYVLIRAAVAPRIARMLSLGPKAAAGDPTAAAEIGQIVERLRTIGFVQLALGVLIILSMVIARLS